MGVQVCALGTSKKTEGDLCRRGPLRCPQAPSPLAEVRQVAPGQWTALRAPGQVTVDELLKLKLQFPEGSAGGQTPEI